MKHTFEIYLSTDGLAREDWSKFYKGMRQYVGTLAKYQIIVVTKDNVIRYFVRCDKDVSAIGNNLDGMILHKVENDIVEIPHSPGKERFIQFVTGGNILDLREKYEVKRNVALEYGVFDVKSVNAEKALVGGRFYFKTLSGTHTRATKTFLNFPGELLSVDLSSESTTYLKKSIPKYLDIEKSMSILSSDSTNSLFEVDGFPYFNSSYYVGLNTYEFDKHSFIVGASGSGKSKLIGLYVDRLSKSAQKQNYRVIVIDPHNSLKDDFEHLQDQKVIEFGKEGAELFSDGSQDIQAATELTATLFRDLMSDDFNNRLERVLRFSLYVLFTAQAMSLDNLKRFVTDLDYRTQIMDHVKGYAPENIMHFFGADFNEIRTQHYNEAISPIVSLVDEMQLQPGMTGADGVSLASTIQNNFLSVFSLNKVSMGEKVVKTVAGLLIQQIFLLAQARQFNEKIILIVDEVSVVQNPALAQILAEARKFNLFVVLTQQYFGQIEKNLQDAIFANVMNYYVFKVSEEDARGIEGNLSINLPKSLVESEHQKGVKEVDIRVKILTELNPRECLLRLSANGQLYPCVKARTVDAEFIHEGVKKEVELKSYKGKIETPGKFVERTGEPQLQSHTQPDSVEHKNVQAPDPLEEVGETADFSIPQMESMPEGPQPAAQAQNGMPQAGGGKTPINLSELLASQSQSRFMVNNKKGKQ